MSGSETREKHAGPPGVTVNTARTRPTAKDYDPEAAEQYAKQEEARRDAVFKAMRETGVPRRGK